MSYVYLECLNVRSRYESTVSIVNRQGETSVASAIYRAGEEPVQKFLSCRQIYLIKSINISESVKSARGLFWDGL